MHELAVCQSLLDQVERLVRAEHARKVTRIRVRCGPLSGVEPHLLQQAFGIARVASIAPAAELVVDVEPLVVWCDHCKRERAVELNRFRCPECGEPCARLVSGDALMLASVELERETSAALGRPPANQGENRIV